jgi:hypothetical protein
MSDTISLVYYNITIWHWTMVKWALHSNDVAFLKDNFQLSYVASDDKTVATHTCLV